MPVKNSRARYRRADGGGRPPVVLSPRETTRSPIRETTPPQDTATGRHRPSRRADPPLLPPRLAAHPQSLAHTVATGTDPPGLSAPGGSAFADRPGTGTDGPSQELAALPRTPLRRTSVGSTLRPGGVGTGAPTVRCPQ